MKKLIIALCILAITACTKPTGKVLFIGVDGLASWCLETALDSIPDQIPNIKGLMDQGRWTLEKRAVYKTASAINWATIFMGVPVEMHGYNKWNSAQPAFTAYEMTEHGMPPTLFSLLKEQRPEAESVCIYDWDGIAPLLDTLSVSKYQYVEYQPDSLSSIDYVKQYGVPVIEAGMPDIFFFYILDPDEVGHKYAWGSPEYYEAMARCDKAIGLLLDALKASPDYASTNIVLTADHGGKPDKKHGSYDLKDFRTPLFICGPGVKPGKVSSFVLQYDTTATLAELLGLKTPAEWRGRSVL